MKAFNIIYSIEALQSLNELIVVIKRKVLPYKVDCILPVVVHSKQILHAVELSVKYTYMWIYVRWSNLHFICISAVHIILILYSCHWLDELNKLRERCYDSSSSKLFPLPVACLYGGQFT